MKHFCILSVLILCSFHIDQRKPVNTPLTGSWISTSRSFNGIKTEFQDSFRITIKPDGRFKSFYRPGNYKSGDWQLKNDTLTLHMKAVDNFEVLELTDSTLEIKEIYKYRDNYTYTFRKKNTK